MLLWPPPLPNCKILTAHAMQSSFSLCWAQSRAYCAISSQPSFQCHHFGSLTLAVSMFESICFVLFSCQVVSDSSRPHRLQHARLSCLSPSPGVCSNSCPLHWWCHPNISPSVTLFSFCLQSFPASGSFPTSWLLVSGSQSLGSVYTTANTISQGSSSFPVKRLLNIYHHKSSYMSSQLSTMDWMFVSPPKNSLYAEILTPNVIALGGQAFKGD